MDIRIKNKQSSRFVVRIDSRTTHGFQVRLPVNDKQISKFFSDGVLGSKAKAKQAAIEYRDKECKRRKITFHPKRILHSKDRRNSTGKIGVSMMWRTVGKYQFKYYVAAWTPRPGASQERKSFSARKHGDRKAKQMAIAHREKMEKKIMGLA